MNLWVNVGCGYWVEPGWIGLDCDRYAVQAAGKRGMDVRQHDVRTGFPFGRNNVECIHSEDFIEHLFPAAAVKYFADSYRVLRPGGTIRTSTPDLEAACKEYLAGTLKDREEWQAYNRERPDWDPAASWGTAQVKHGCEAINALFSWWGHHWIYDEAYLRLLLERAGFVEITRRGRGESAHEAFKEVDRRAGNLILEARKPS
jgi:predicted SAM-dependent methyltransferase